MECYYREFLCGNQRMICYQWSQSTISGDIRCTSSIVVIVMKSSISSFKERIYDSIFD